MKLCLTYHVNHDLSLRKTAESIREIHSINMVALSFISFDKLFLLYKESFELYYH